MQEEYASLRALMMARAYLYELFHKVLGGRPTAELLDILSSSECADALEEYTRPENDLARFACLAASFKAASPGLVSQLADEYNRALVGIGKPGMVLWESPYVSRVAALFNESVLDVRRYYQDDGLRAKRHQQVPEDHLSMMLAFMAQSAKRSYRQASSASFASLAARLAREGAFARAHLGNWLGEAVDAVPEEMDVTFYANALRAVASFVRADQVFAAEALLWIEGLAAEDLPACEGRDESFDRMEQALALLEGLRLPFLEDAELTKSAYAKLDIHSKQELLDIVGMQ